jgi:hypothetical protein
MAVPQGEKRNGASIGAHTQQYSHFMCENALSKTGQGGNPKQAS